MSELKGIEMETTVQRSEKRTLLEPKLVGQINQHVLNLLLGQRDRGIRRPGGLSTIQKRGWVWGRREPRSQPLCTRRPKKSRYREGRERTNVRFTSPESTSSSVAAAASVLAVVGVRRRASPGGGDEPRSSSSHRPLLLVVVSPLLLLTSVTTLLLLVVLLRRG